ncbi:hypothetical protein VFPPC_17386 [Pochonia chlamydosporia 170]|uniref:Uncharacterized protein n=1 Tax=Pochonia chlamydosporia 170 TaxID=1380566 RepID=A0A219ATF5_METCM|nr:hypothetical protein VFPPC_17386 [Pochonia chlamydosporia 170]OWT43465.1 hypothetical protein VFPPC_17386 [Pochonia chlamydosporia 170]
MPCHRNHDRYTVQPSTIQSSIFRTHVLSSIETSSFPRKPFQPSSQLQWKAPSLSPHFKCSKIIPSHMQPSIPHHCHQQTYMSRQPFTLLHHHPY